MRGFPGGTDRDETLRATAHELGVNETALHTGVRLLPPMAGRIEGAQAD